MELRHTERAPIILYTALTRVAERAGESYFPWERKSMSLCIQKGYLVFQAHPFRPYILRCNPNYIDGVEIYNAKPRKLNDKAYEWAKRKKAHVRVLILYEEHMAGAEL
jgi:hypothetical protein